MLAKLARERDREWLIEVAANSGTEALIYLREDDCLVVTPDGDTDVAARASLTDSHALEDLIAESSRAGATFDVYFRRATPARVEEVEEIQTAAPVAIPAASETSRLRSPPRRQPRSKSLKSLGWRQARARLLRPITMMQNEEFDYR